MSSATASIRIRNPSKSMRSADVLDHCALVALWLLAEVNTGFGLILTISTYAPGSSAADEVRWLEL